MIKENSSDICIVGAGLVGSLLSILLAQRGLNVRLIERRPDMRAESIAGGRSINMALSDRGLAALQLIGLDEEIMAQCIPMVGRAVHDEGGGEVRLMRYGNEDQWINSVSRGGLNKKLLEVAGRFPNIKMSFNARVTDIDFRSNEIQFKDERTGEKFTEKHDVYFGTDGAFSAVRMAMMKSESFSFAYSQDYIEAGYKELCIPPAEDGSFRLDKNALHIWPRHSFMMIALPNLDGSFTCTLFLEMKGEPGFDKLKTEQDVIAFYQQYFPDALPMMPTLTQDFFTNPTNTLVTVRCAPWNLQNKAVLLGDAAHALVPFYGQGMNAGFEDCTRLMELMDQYGTDWEVIFPEFSRIRKPNGDAVADLALRNFIEMRDGVADKHFILKNKMDKMMGRLYPGEWIPLYSMVTFTHMDYVDALRLGNEHDQWLEELLQRHPEAANMTDEELETLLASNYQWNAFSR